VDIEPVSQADFGLGKSLKSQIYRAVGIIMWGAALTDSQTPQGTFWESGIDMSGQERPLEWKNDEDFSAAIDTSRLPPSTALAGREFGVDFEGRGQLDLRFAADRVAWTDRSGSGTDSCA
jgi:hypothetical protein